MSEDFDPYFKWLGIPSEEQPPNHYRLLGVPLFVDDLDVISNAADQRMAHLRGFQSGPHSAESQKLLNNVSTARGCLLDSTRKAEYDAELRQQLAGEGENSRTAPTRMPAAVPMALPPGKGSGIGQRTAANRSRPASPPPKTAIKPRRTPEQKRLHARLNIIGSIVAPVLGLGLCGGILLLIRGCSSDLVVEQARQESNGSESHKVEQARQESKGSDSHKVEQAKQESKGSDSHKVEQARQESKESDSHEVAKPVRRVPAKTRSGSRKKSKASSPKQAHQRPAPKPAVPVKPPAVVPAQNEGPKLNPPHASPTVSPIAGPATVIPPNDKEPPGKLLAKSDLPKKHETPELSLDDRIHALEQSAEKAMGPEEFTSIAEQGMTLVRQAISEHRQDLARRCANVSLAAARNCDCHDQLRQITLLVLDVQQMKSP